MASNILSHGASHLPESQRDTHHDYRRERDPGAWLMMMAPVTFLMTLIAICWLSLSTLP